MADILNILFADDTTRMMLDPLLDNIKIGFGLGRFDDGTFFTLSPMQSLGRVFGLLVKGA